MKPRDYQKFIYGNDVSHDLEPVISNAVVASSIQSPSGSATITCNSAIPGGTRTYDVITYNDGDILFYTDGHLIWDSTNALMSGCPSSGAGGIGNGTEAQPVYVARAPDTLNGAQGLNNEIFWVFTHTSGGVGIQVHVVDMNRNGGRGQIESLILEF